MPNSKYLFIGLGALALVGACAPKTQPVTTPVLMEPVYSKTGGGQGSCPSGYSITRTTAAPQRDVCVPSDCDDPFWGSGQTTAVAGLPWCVPPPQTYREEGSGNGNGGQRGGPNDPTTGGQVP